MPNRFVDVNVSITPAESEGQDFSTPMIAAFHAVDSARVRFFSSAKEAVSSGHSATGAVALALGQMFAQSPKPAKVAVGRLANAPDLTYTLSPVLASSTNYQVRLRNAAGTVAIASFTSGASATAAQVSAGIVAAITALALPGIVAADASPNLTVKASAAGQWFAVEPVILSEIAPQVAPLGTIGVSQSHVDAGVTADLTAILAANDSWTGFSLLTAGNAELEAASVWAETNRKSFIATSYDTVLRTSATGHVGATARIAARERTTVAHHHKPSEFFGPAYMADFYGYEPGRATAALKTLNGVSAQEFSTTEIGILDGNFVERYAVAEPGFQPVTQLGQVSSSQFLDVVRDSDWFINLVRRGIYRVLSANPKVPFTDEGRVLIEAAVRGDAAVAASQGFIDSGSFTFSFPAISATTAADRATRWYRPVAVSARIQGAIHRVTLNAALSP